MTNDKLDINMRATQAGRGRGSQLSLFLLSLFLVVLLLVLVFTMHILSGSKVEEGRRAVKFGIKDPLKERPL